MLCFIKGDGMGQSVTVLLLLTLGAVSFFISSLTSSSLVLCSLLVGALTANLSNYSITHSKNISVLENLLIGTTIALLGLRIKVSSIIELGPKIAFTITVLIIIILVLSFILGKLLKISSTLSFFIGVGSAICGSAAIAAVSKFFHTPQDKEEAAISIGIVNLVGLFGLMILPGIIKGLNLSSAEAGLLVGGSLQSFGHVLAMGFTMSANTGEYSVLIKMGRVIFLAPLIIALGWKNQRQKNSTGLSILPLYVYAHIACFIISNTINLPLKFYEVTTIVFKTSIAFAMICLGLKIRFSKIKKSGAACVLASLLFIVLIVSLSFARFIV